MTRDEKLGVAVVGLGIGARHARAFDNHSACRIRYLFDLDIAAANSLASEFSDCAVARTYSEIIESSDVDIVVIASYDDAHYTQVIDALSAGKHVFVEKPLCQTYKELQNIKKVWLATPNPPILRSNLVLRSAQYYQWLKNIINEGGLGEIYAIDGDYLYGRVHKITEGWRSGVEEYSVMEGGGVHLIDMVIWITGQRPTSVTASGNRICTEGTSFRYNDYIAASFEFESGLIARVTANFGCVHRHHHVFRVFGTKATALYDDAGSRLHVSRDPEMPVEQIKIPALPLDKSDLIPQFVDAILSNNNDQNETQSFFDGISISVAASRALMTGKKERIKYV